MDGDWLREQVRAALVEAKVPERCLRRAVDGVVQAIDVDVRERSRQAEFELDLALQMARSSAGTIAAAARYAVVGQEFSTAEARGGFLKRIEEVCRHYENDRRDLGRVE